MASPSPTRLSKVTVNIKLETLENRTIFMPGQKVEGHLILSASHAVDIKLLRIRFSGIVQAQLYKNDTSQNVSTMTLFKEIQTYIGSAVPSDPSVSVPAGEQRFPFAFRVPPSQLPASFEGPYGRVRYEVAAVCARPHHLNKLTFLNLTVPSTTDATDLDLIQPSLAMGQAPVGFWLWKSGHLEVTVSAPKTGFASEEVVPLKVEITNHSGAGACLKEIYLKQRVTYRTAEDVRGPVTERIHRLSFSEHYSHLTRRINRVINFPIPSTSIMSPTITTSILDVSHVIIVKVVSRARLSKPVKVELPIVIAGFPAVYFDNYVFRTSTETLPAYETTDNRSAGLISRISQEWAHIRRRSRSGASSQSQPQGRRGSVASLISLGTRMGRNGRRRSRSTGETEPFVAGPEWEAIVENLPPIPEIPAQHRRPPGAPVNMNVTPNQMPRPPLTRPRSSTDPGSIRPPIEEITPTFAPVALGTRHRRAVSAPEDNEDDVTRRRRSAALVTVDHGLEGEFGATVGTLRRGAQEETVALEGQPNGDCTVLAEDAREDEQPQLESEQHDDSNAAPTLAVPAGLQALSELDEDKAMHTEHAPGDQEPHGENGAPANVDAQAASMMDVPKVEDLPAEVAHHPDESDTPIDGAGAARGSDNDDLGKALTKHPAEEVVCVKSASEDVSAVENSSLVTEKHSSANHVTRKLGPHQDSGVLVDNERTSRQ
ncbi:Arrestin domain-containing protein 1 [Gaertneriomyces sp. JEL0708]|nr:Arrestin domain-containing protein 1 [Gaertneriomyces sp. JEL0708]